jgi:thiamine kinase-like enzyme
MPEQLKLVQISDQNIIDYLICLKLCSSSDKETASIELKPAKNFNLLVSLSSGKKLLVKQERQIEEGKTLDELSTAWQFHCFLQENLELAFLEQQIPKILHFDSANSIMVVEYVDEYEDLHNLYLKKRLFLLNIPQKMGHILGNLHKFSTHREDCQQSFQPKIVYTDTVRALEHVSPEIFSLLPPDSIKFIALYQRYDSLQLAVTEVMASWSPTCLIHGDFKVNNILALPDFFSGEIGYGKQLHQQPVRVIDWERCCWGDPVYDLGTMIASYLLIWLSSLVIDNSISINESLRMAAIPLEQLQPSIKEFYQSYLEVFPQLLRERPDLQKQTVQHTGFALIRQIQAALQYEHRLGNLSICMLQVAKSLVCRPEEFIPTVFGS